MTAILIHNLKPYTWSKKGFQSFCYCWRLCNIEYTA